MSINVDTIDAIDIKRGFIVVISSKNKIKRRLPNIYSKEVLR